MRNNVDDKRSGDAFSNFKIIKSQAGGSISPLSFRLSHQHCTTEKRAAAETAFGFGCCCWWE
jgi:hypothetical protein